MGFNRFGLHLAIRLIIIMLAFVGVGFLIVTPGYHAATLLALIVVVSLSFEVFRFVSKTNQELARFLDAARYADFGQRFTFDSLGAGFGELGDTFTYILDRFREDRNQHEQELRHLRALVEHVPVPLISIYADNQITLWNNAARRLFGVAQIRRLVDLEPFGLDFAKQIAVIQPGQRILTSFQIDNTEEQLTLSASEIIIASMAERLISLQNIQSELDGMQLKAWQDLVRVLTHEIMNSITPVASLAKTAADLVDDVSTKIADKTEIGSKIGSEIVEELQDVKDAVNTVARRSDGLMNFVSSYRQLSRLPEPEKTRFQVNELFADVNRMIAMEWQQKEIILESKVEPLELDVIVDRQMVEQVLLNLLQNCTHALTGVSNARVELFSRLNKRGHVTIAVSDNGVGIADDVANRIFVPFYTTRREGSGVGLALSRQVMIAHGGSISYTKNEHGGARFTLVF
ncbi:MAG: ATP-binding protein [Pseudomonadales bacterium]|jgi:nitrogen fixation/metabolism regulation signal transduction histidine kinase